MRSLVLPLRRVTTPWDAVLAGVLVVAAAWETALTSADRPGLRAALAAGAVAGVAARRRVPPAAAGVLAAGMVLEAVLTESTDEISVLVALLLVSYSVAARAPLGTALVGEASIALAVVVSVALDPSDSLGNVLPSLALFVLLPGALGLVAHQGRRDLAVLSARADALAREAEEAVEAERRRIARELHDVVSHAVTVIAVQAEAGAATLDTDPAAARRSLESIGAVSREALAELHRLLGLLQEGGGGPASDAGLERLPALVAGVRAAGLAVEVVQSGDRRTLPAEADHCAYRVLQEALTNALRHAPSSTVQVQLEYDVAGVRVEVSSRGRRHTSSYGGTGRGLAGLRERVTALGGSFDTVSDAGAFRVSATLPAGAS